MDNYKLLEKYRKKLSIYFALFVLLSFWITQIIFLLIDYIPENIDLEKNLELKYLGVTNVIKNYYEYSEKINNNDITLGKILSKTLENVEICINYKDGICSEKMLNNINDNTDIIYTSVEKYYNFGKYKYLKKDFDFNNKKYIIIIKIFNEHSNIKMLQDYLYFILFSLPFSLFFYFIGYFFVGKNFQPIKETISGLEDFTSNINHEMKTPLTEIISTLSLAKRTKNYDEAINKSLNSSMKLNKILDAMLGIVNIIDFRYKNERIDLIKELNNITKYYSKEIEKKDIKIEKKYLNNQYYLNINKDHFDICVGNILKNAIKYSEKSGIIIIVFEEGVLEIIDNGVGISQENLTNIFDRYFRENYTDQAGYGIGLSIVKKIVDIHSWKINIKSRKKKTMKGDKGTNVKISFI